MTNHLPADDHQAIRHNYRQVAEILSMFHTELRKRGLPRWLVGALVLRQYEMMTREFRMPNIIFASHPLEGFEPPDDEG